MNTEWAIAVDTARSHSVTGLPSGCNRDEAQARLSAVEQETLFTGRGSTKVTLLTRNVEAWHPAPSAP